ncbi:Uncharacterised protein [uncultured archaeon]|nr:Uncharacterised protein [uncultured archaeon]
MLNVIIPLAGKDPRFEKLRIPKALIPINGKPLVRFCTDNLPYPFNEKNIQIYFIILEEHDKKFNFSKKLKELYPSSFIKILKEPTEGAVCTVLTLKNQINNDDELIVYLADIYFKGNLKNIISSETNVCGFIPSFSSNNPKYSYSIVDKDNFVSEVAEKKVISNNASAGFYYFRKGSIFVESAEKMISENKRVNNAFFICPVYNEVILKNKVKIITVDFVFDLGDDSFIKKYVTDDLYDKSSNL